MIKQKLQQASDILKELDIDLWLTFARESSVTTDPMLEYIAGVTVTWESAFIVTATGESIAIVGSLDAGGLRAQNDYGQITTYLKSIREPLCDTLNRLAPRTIAVNYSADIPAADGLSYGLYQKLCGYLHDTPYAQRLRSAEPVITRLRGRKTETELDFMRQAITETLDLFELAGKAIRPGRSEKDLAALVHGEMEKRSLEPAWDKSMCPAVFTGPGTAGAHAAPTARPVQPGHLVNMDLGVRIGGYCADLQRTWYVLVQGETTPPDEVRRGFTVLLESIDLAAAALKPGVSGVEIDAVARGHLAKNGYEGYPHGLGHQLGRAAHDGGALLAPSWERYGQTPFIPLEAGQVFTIEPRLTIAGHGVITIEEEVVVTATGVQIPFRSAKETLDYLKPQILHTTFAFRPGFRYY